MTFPSRDAFPARGGVDDKTDDRFPLGGGLRSAPGPAVAPAGPAPYAELHAHSAYSFLDGASLPEELAARAAELGYEALALTDHDGVYGSLEFAIATKGLGGRPNTGAGGAGGGGPAGAPPGGPPAGRREPVPAADRGAPGPPAEGGRRAAATGAPA